MKIRFKKENLLLLGLSNHDPQDINTFFKPIVDELKELDSFGFDFENQNFKVKLHFFTADLVAKKKVTK